MSGGAKKGVAAAVGPLFFHASPFAYSSAQMKNGPGHFHGAGPLPGGNEIRVLFFAFAVLFDAAESRMIFAPGIHAGFLAGGAAIFYFQIPESFQAHLLGGVLRLVLQAFQFVENIMAGQYALVVIRLVGLHISRRGRVLRPGAGCGHGQCGRKGQ